MAKTSDKVEKILLTVQKKEEKIIELLDELRVAVQAVAKKKDTPVQEHPRFEEWKNLS